MNDTELFKTVFDRIVNKNSSIKMSGSLVCLRGVPRFNTAGFNLAYNLHRLTNLLEETGEFI